MAASDAQQESLKKLLEDIQQPPLPEQFYLPPGYLLLGLLVGLGLFVGLRWWQRRRQRLRPRQLALDALQQIQAKLVQPTEVPVAAHSNAIILVLKQYIQSRVPSHPVLVQPSAQFLQFLQQSISAAAVLPDADWLLYSGQADLAAVTALHDFAALWLKQHPESALDV